MRNTSSEKGSAPTLAIFTIFIIVSTGLVMTYLQNSEEREISSIQLLRQGVSFLTNKVS